MVRYGMIGRLGAKIWVENRVAFAVVGYHGVRPFLPPHLRAEPQAGGRAYEGGTMLSTGNVETSEGELSPFRVDDAVDNTEEGRRRE